MAVGIRCLYCGRIGYTSSPQMNSTCPYCGREQHPSREKEAGIKGKAIILIPGQKEDKKKDEQYSL